MLTGAQRWLRAAVPTSRRGPLAFERPGWILSDITTAAGLAMIARGGCWVQRCWRGVLARAPRMVADRCQMLCSAARDRRNWLQGHGSLRAYSLGPEVLRWDPQRRCDPV
jgi:hypothetical protein